VAPFWTTITAIRTKKGSVFQKIAFIGVWTFWRRLDLGQLIHDPEKNGNINIRVYRIIQCVPTARVGGRRTARISAV
jgi:hypothetical protein